MAQKQTALITGASGGIGLALAKLFARDGYHLVLVARNEEKLQSLAKSLADEFDILVFVVAKDLSDPKAPAELYAEVSTQNITVDALVNNAGFATHGYFVETDLARELQELQLNITTLTHLSKLFGRDMAKRRMGKILNVASTAAFQPGPMMAVYFATKAYVLSFSEALANEMADFGVTVSALCPGATATNFFNTAEMTDSGFVEKMRMMSAEDVAEIGYRGLMRKKPVVITGFFNKVMAFSTRFVPRSLTVKIARALQ